MAEYIQKKSNSFSFDFLWDLWCIFSIIGIWPRFIEPYLLEITNLPVKVSHLPESLRGLKIVQLSDLHFHPGVPDFFLQKIIKKVKVLHPEILVLTGDFICQSTLFDKKRLKDFLCSFTAPYGCFAVLGNHDYQAPVSINSEGEYDIINSSSSSISKGFKRLFSSIKLIGRTTEKVKQIGLHSELIELINQTPFILLENECRKIALKDTYLNICGLGEYTLGKALPSIAFENYDSQFPGLILTHNPDSIPLLKNFPGDLILCGHTHGGQVNLPWICKKLTLLENMEYIRGLFHIHNKWVYVNRGLGSVMPFRWFAKPEIVSMTLE